jgi:hypothetical protein
MNLGSDQGLDALLKDWPGPVGAGDEESAWEARAEGVVKAALAAKGESESVLDALTGPPGLAREPGEPGESMSIPAGPASIGPASLGGERKRSSLKDIAARAAAGSTSRSSAPGASGPASLPPLASGDRASSPGRASSPPVSARPSAAPSRPVEAGKEDSGVINLNAVNASATPAEVAAAAAAKPGQAGLYDDAPASSTSSIADESTFASAVNPSEKIPHSKVPQIAVVAAPKNDNNTGRYAGIAIAVLGIAAAFAILARKPAQAPVATNDHAVTAVATQAPAPVAAPTTPAATAAPTATAVAVSQLESTDDAKPGAPKRPAVTSGSPGAAPPVAGPIAAPAKDDATAAAKATAAPNGKPGDLQQEMAKAVGPIDKANQDAPPVEPAAGGPRNQNVPEQPSQGSVQAAIGTVMGSAKGCVSGADDVTRASITFSSAGAVSSVSVQGWAAAHGQSGCVQGALKGAKVGPFSKPSYVVSVTIRP